MLGTSGGRRSISRSDLVLIEQNDSSVYFRPHRGVYADLFFHQLVLGHPWETIKRGNQWIFHQPTVHYELVDFTHPNCGTSSLDRTNGRLRLPTDTGWWWPCSWRSSPIFRKPVPSNLHIWPRRTSRVCREVGSGLLWPLILRENFKLITKKKR